MWQDATIREYALDRLQVDIKVRPGCIGQPRLSQVFRKGVEPPTQPDTMASGKATRMCGNCDTPDTCPKGRKLSKATVRRSFFSF